MSLLSRPSTSLSVNIRNARWLLSAALVFSAASASAQDPDAPNGVAPAVKPSSTDRAQASAPKDIESGGEYRVVGGHQFITPTNAYSAMMNTSFRFSQGFGVATFEQPSPTTNQPTPGRLFLYGQQFQGQLGISNRVSIDLRAQGSAAIGGDLDTILGVGGLALLNVGAMPKVRLFTLENIGFQASLGAGVFYDRNLQIRPSALISKAIGDVAGAEGQLIQQSGQLNVVPALMLAQGSGPIGVQMSAAPKIAVSATNDNKESGFDFGTHVAFDFHKVTATVPVALAAEYGMFYTGSGTNHFVGGGIYYSGRRDFEFGLASGISPSSAISMYQGQMVMQYYF